MASAPSLRIGLSPPTPRLWPDSAARRWTASLLLAAPMIVLAVVADRRVGASVGNALLIERSALVTAGGFDGVRWGYPPIPTLVAGIVDDPLALSIVGCLLGGAAGFVVIQRMYARGLPAWLQVLIVASIGLMPSAWYVFTQDSDGMMGLALLVIALDGFERFAMEAETIGGFVTGLALGAAVLCDPSAIVYAIALAAAAPLAAAARYRGEPGVTAATVLVFGFPAAAALTSWAYIEWRFTGGAFHTLGVDRDLLSFDGGLWASLRRKWRQRNRILLHTPLFVSSPSASSWRCDGRSRRSRRTCYHCSCCSWPGWSAWPTRRCWASSCWRRSRQ